MPQYGWTICPHHIRQPVEAFARALLTVLESNLTGLYLHGSLAMNCFNPARSDIDLLAVTREAVPAELMRSIAYAVLAYSANPTPFELSIVRETYLNPWQYPTPFDFHYSENLRETTEAALASREWTIWTGDPPPTDPDLAAHITITRARGIVVVGKPIRDVFPDVPQADYVDSLMADFAFARRGMNENPVYAVLNFCRIYSYLRDGRFDSKDEAGEWALRHLPAEYHGLIEAALDSYRNNSIHTWDPDALNAFADYMAAAAGEYVGGG